MTEDQVSQLAKNCVHEHGLPVGEIRHICRFPSDLRPFYRQESKANHGDLWQVTFPLIDANDEITSNGSLFLYVVDDDTGEILAQDKYETLLEITSSGHVKHLGWWSHRKQQRREDGT